MNTFPVNVTGCLVVRDRVQANVGVRICDKIFMMVLVPDVILLGTCLTDDMISSPSRKIEMILQKPPENLRLMS